MKLVTVVICVLPPAGSARAVSARAGSWPRPVRRARSLAGLHAAMGTGKGIF